MALIHCNFSSQSLGMASAMDVILPEGGAARPHPCLYLLHGLSDDHTIWQRRTAIERHVQGLDLAVVMPNVHRSFYADMASGYAYWTFVSDELPQIVQSLFHISARRSDTFVAGLSMGGYGAFKLALRNPSRFAAAASLSGALDLAARSAETIEDNGLQGDFSLVFGRGVDITGTPGDLLACAAALAASEDPLPALYQWCGTEDFLYEDNLRFRDHARELGLPLTYEESAGDHQWQYWDRQIQRVLEWLPLAPA